MFILSKYCLSPVSYSNLHLIFCRSHLKSIVLTLMASLSLKLSLVHYSTAGISTLRRKYSLSIATPVILISMSSMEVLIFSEERTKSKLVSLIVCVHLFVSLRFLGHRNITKVHLEGVENAIKENPDGEPGGIKVHFRMDESGILQLDSVSFYTV